MKKTLFRLTTLTLVCLSLLSVSCVSVKKLHTSEARVDKLQKENMTCNNQLMDTRGKLEKTNSQLAVCEENVKTIKASNINLQDEYVSAINDLREMASKSKMNIADQTLRLKNLEEYIRKQNESVNNLKNSIAKALVNYKTDELSVYIKDGNVYVSLAEKLLFKSGSATVDSKGKEALKTLSQVLNTTSDINVVIEGHTDNVPIKSNQFKDNWDLSTARATSIVRILTADYGFDSNRITASGKGQFHPVQSNETAAGRTGNRRTEIILSPDLKEIFTLLYK